MFENLHTAIVGANASGKSALIDKLMGELSVNEPQKIVRYILFCDSYGSATTDYYYQQRWNSQDAELSDTVSLLFERHQVTPFQQHIFDVFDIGRLLDKRIVHLSNGELRKIQIAQSLTAQPDILIIDNPFIGLDCDMRQLFACFLEELVTVTSTQLIIVQPDNGFIPKFITNVVCVGDNISNIPTVNIPTVLNFDSTLLPTQTAATSNNNEVINFNNVTIRYGEHTLLSNLCWRVCRGEHWIVTGANGAGKSTLLSILCADNPQSYSCDIRLFGRQRGSGETIWDIKKRIGYLSPEMHRAFRENIPIADVVVSGFNDMMGLFYTPTTAEREIANRWMELFSITHLKQRPFLRTSSGEQRLALLARAFVKSPELLILDEPFPGLDSRNMALTKAIIESYCSSSSATLIMVTHYEEEIPVNIATKRLHLTACQYSY